MTIDYISYRIQDAVHKLHNIVEIIQLEAVKDDWERGNPRHSSHIPLEKQEFIEHLKKIIDPFGGELGNEKNFKIASETGNHWSVGVILGECLIEECVLQDIPFPYKKILLVCYDNIWGPPFTNRWGGRTDLYEEATKENSNSPYNLNNYKENEILVILYDRRGLTDQFRLDIVNYNQQYKKEGIEMPAWMKSGPSPFKIVNIDLKSSLEIIGKKGIPDTIKEQLDIEETI